MNESEHGLVVIIEELSELSLELSDMAASAARAQQAACKAVRFGVKNGYPESDRTNGADLVREANDLIGALELFTDKLALKGLFDRNQIEAKKAKINNWLEHSKSVGTLT